LSLDFPKATALQLERRFLVLEIVELQYGVFGVLALEIVVAFNKGT